HRGPLTEIIDIEPGKTARRNMCIAADIGTTTVVCHLVDLCDGQTLGKAGKYNSQIRYGGDIIRRIIHASESGSQDDLRKSIVGDLNDLIGQLVKEHRLSLKDISLVSAAGNTTMVHLLAGLPVANIRKEPYIGAAYNLPPFRAAETGLQIHPRGLLYCLPCVAGFVGADTVAGIFASGMTGDDKVRMLIDIGTNGEIVVGNKDFLVCASASAGPAFEGGECSCGMRASAGAIDHIRLLDADTVLSYSTINSADPVGICGTGYIDTIAEMLRIGVIDKTGRISAEASASRVRTRDDGELEYLLTDPEGNGDNPDVTITQEDINNIMRAKGAIYAAESVLLSALNMTFDDIAEVMVAGAFGNFLNVDNSVFIGLLPDVPSEKLRFVGNTSLAGAKLAALSDECYDEIFRIAANTTYFELSTEPTFMDQFVSACFFPHTNLDLFPSVMSVLDKKSGH
ncbi:MAG: ATP-binding protein, partial [bacterium]|nr:ATP-binding protein [bacterium]